ncbi:hypothetical protein AB718_19650, partial [Acinetobacter baumannii]
RQLFAHGQQPANSADGEEDRPAGDFITQRRGSHAIQRIKGPQRRAKVHRRGNKPDPHQYPQAEHAAHHALLLLTGKLACHQRQRQNNKAAYDALAEDR